jgi:hypothetical protein
VSLTHLSRPVPRPLHGIFRDGSGYSRLQAKTAGARHCDPAAWRTMGTLTTYDDLLAHAQALIATTDRIPVIGISGHGGSGRSTLAERLGADLGLAGDQVVPTDCFYATTSSPSHGFGKEWRFCGDP